MTTAKERASSSSPSGGVAAVSPTVLLTGFEPFGGEAVNPSAEVAAALHGAVVAGHRVVTAVLPCVFSSAGPALTDAIARTDPVLVLALGLAGGRAELGLERVALNLKDARICDNEGEQPLDGEVVPGGPSAWFSSLPVKAMAQGLRERGIPAVLSLSAGTFVCNAVFYALMNDLSRRRGVRGGFIHLPFLPEQAARHSSAPGMPLGTMMQAVTWALEIALRTPEDIRVPGGSLY